MAYTQKRQQNQDQTTSKTIWRPVLTQMQGSNESHRQTQSSTSITSLEIQNVFANLEMQDQHETDQTREVDKTKNEYNKSSTITTRLNTHN